MNDMTPAEEAIKAVGYTVKSAIVEEMHDDMLRPIGDRIVSAFESSEIALKLVELLDKNVNALKDLTSLVADLRADVDSILQNSCPPVGDPVVNENASSGLVDSAGTSCPDPTGGLRQILADSDTDELDGCHE